MSVSLVWGYIVGAEPGRGMTTCVSNLGEGLPDKEGPDLVRRLVEDYHRGEPHRLIGGPLLFSDLEMKLVVLPTDQVLQFKRF